MVNFRSIKKVALLYGGDSNEHEISVRSAQCVHQALLELGFKVLKVDIKDLSDTDLQSVDFAFIICHGGQGEDGRLQGYLELLNIPFSGSDTAVCALSMDKYLTKLLWQSVGLPTAKSRLIKLGDSLHNFDLQFPLVVKPNFGGSSYGMSKVVEANQLSKAIDTARKFCSTILLEEWIEGEEYTVSFVQDQALEPIHIIAEGGFYDYNAKYQAKNTQYLFDVDEDLKKILQNLATEAYQAIRASSWGRVDMIQSKSGEIYLLEFNTVPGMTNRSLMPTAAKQEGWDYNELIRRIILSSLRVDSE